MKPLSTLSGLRRHFNKLQNIRALQLTDLLASRGLPIVCANAPFALPKPSRPPQECAGLSRSSKCEVLKGSGSSWPKTSLVPAFKHKKWGEKTFNSRSCCFQTCRLILWLDSGGGEAREGGGTFWMRNSPGQWRRLWLARSSPPFPQRKIPSYLYSHLLR